MKHKLLFLSCTKTKAQNADNSDIHFCLLYSFPYVVQCCFFSLSFYAILSHLTILLILVKRLKNVFVFVLFRNVKAATLSNRNLNDPKIIIKLLMRLTFKKKVERTHKIVISLHRVGMLTIRATNIPSNFMRRSKICKMKIFDKHFLFFPDFLLVYFLSCE